MSGRWLLASGIAFALLAVMLGAFGAHALRDVVVEQQLQTWQTASEYQFYHALGLIALGIYADKSSPRLILTLCGIAMSTGVLLFSGSLYLLVVTGYPLLGAITPIGGMLMIVAWALWLFAVLLQPRS